MVQKRSISEILWDLWCVTSVVGVWPRYIEPNLLQTTKLKLKIPDIDNLKVVQLSDLHLNEKVPDFFISKLIRKVKNFSPDLIVFTGDFLCYSTLDNRKRMTQILNEFNAPYGCFAILGNHDYQQRVVLNKSGEYDICDDHESDMLQGFRRLLNPIFSTGTVTERARNVTEHQELIDVLRDTPFVLLNNETKLIPVNNGYLNICGLGEYTMGRCHPEKAFQEYKSDYPGIILAHNPDSIPHIIDYPGQVILCGHTHGGQINLPLVWKRLTFIENMKYKRGLYNVQDKCIYVNRGIGSTFRFRWFSIPEILYLTLEGIR